MRVNDRQCTEVEQVQSEGRWYAANTRPNVERTAITNLARQGFRSFLAARMKTTHHARQFRSSIAPLFPGYLFVWLDLSRDRWRSVNGTHGVVSLVMTGSETLPVPQGVVETLIEMSSKRGIVCFNHELNSGQRVKILAGPFAYQLGTLEHLDDRGRLEVLLDIMCVNPRVAFAADEVIPS